jgi:8-oxo-dGTP pyrophosphatase MutT (NUDIX family)
MDWKVLASKIGFSDRWFRYRIDTCQMPNGTIIDPYYVLEYTDWCAALALTEDMQVIMVKLYRHGLGKTIIEIPGGAMEKDENDPDATIRRELLEETGYAFDEIIKTAVVSPNPSNHSNLFHAYLALGGKKVKEQELDQGEEIETLLFSLKEFKAFLDRNELLQAMHVSACYYGLRELEKRGIKP